MFVSESNCDPRGMPISITGNIPSRESYQSPNNYLGEISTKDSVRDPGGLPRIMPDGDPTKEPSTSPVFVDSIRYPIRWSP